MDHIITDFIARVKIFVRVLQMICNDMQQITCEQHWYIRWKYYNHIDDIYLTLIKVVKRLRLVIRQQRSLKCIKLQLQGCIAKYMSADLYPRSYPGFYYSTRSVNPVLEPMAQVSKTDFTSEILSWLSWYEMQTCFTKEEIRGACTKHMYIWIRHYDDEIWQYSRNHHFDSSSIN